MFKVNWEKTVEKYLEFKESEDSKKAKAKKQAAKTEPLENKELKDKTES